MGAALLLLVTACGSPTQYETGPADASPDASVGVSTDASVDASVEASADASADSTSTPAPEAGTGASDAFVAPSDANADELDGGGCGYMDAGKAVHVAANIDVCLPKVACTAETCPPQLGQCVNDACVFQPGYLGVATFPEAWVTYYCDLAAGGCRGVTQLELPEVTAQQIATAKQLPVCALVDGGTPECVGIAASPPMLSGNSQVAIDSLTNKLVTDWGQGLTEASGLCYELVGPAGTVLVALTDRCGGYCECNGSGFEECGPCVNAADMVVQCSCVGTAPPAYSACCGQGCGTVNLECDWCASNNHPHFDLDLASYNQVCGALAYKGSCQLTSVRYVPCLDATGWPP